MVIVLIANDVDRQPRPLPQISVSLAVRSKTTSEHLNPFLLDLNV